MKKKNLQVVFLIILSWPCVAQTAVRGKVLNAGTRQPIPYANIGIPNANVGTMSNQDGTFSIRIPDKFDSDSLVFSAIGFGKRKIPVGYFQFRNGGDVLLNEKITVLNDVVVSDKREKLKVYEVGNKSVKGGVLEQDTLYAGRSVALLIDNTRDQDMQFPLYLENVKLRILRNNLASFKFRIRLNAVDPITGAPAADLLEKSITLESTLRSGWLEFDVSDLGIIMYEPFFITFEQITDKNDRTKIANGYREYIRKNPKKLIIDTVDVYGEKQAHMTLKGGIDLPGTFIAIDNNKSSTHTSYTRLTSLGEWEKVRGIVTAFATLSTLPSQSAGAQQKCTTTQCTLEKRCRDFMDENGLNGLQVSVSRKREKLFSINLGLADVGNHVAVDASTRFRINSVSKAITATALVKLAQEGKINLDVPVQTYVGEFPRIHEVFTLRQLAGHLAGMRDYDEKNMSDFERHQHYRTATEAMSIIRNDTLLSKPGSQFHYSTFGWIAIGAAMEAACRSDYGNLMTTTIFEYLHLDHTCLDDRESVIKNRSRFYDVAGNENEYGDFSYKYAGGGLLSTADDLAAFGNAVLADSFVDDRAKKLLFTSQRTSGGVETGYGIGWYVGVDDEGRRIWHHSGDTFSSSSHLVIYPDEQVVISFLANGQAGAAFDWQAIADLVLSSE